MEYTEGLRKPTGPFPAASRASLIRVIMDPTTGEEAEVPKISWNAPLRPGCGSGKNGMFEFRERNIPTT